MQDFAMPSDGAGETVSNAVETVRSLFGTPRPHITPAPANSTPDDVVRDPQIAIVDDQSINVKVVQKHLTLAGYQRFVTTTDAREAVAMVERDHPDVLLLDIMMPHVSGLEILASLRSDARFVDLPVIILTAATDKDTKLAALNLGATEFLNKPLEHVELETRVRNVLVSKARQDRLRQYTWELELEVAMRCAELASAHQEIVLCLATVCEYRDDEAGRHILRVGRYAEIIARRLGLDHEFAERIRYAATLHDIGKIGVSDQVLRKPGKLDESEWEAMRRHCEFGRRMCFQLSDKSSGCPLSHPATGESDIATGSSPLLRMAGSIAYTHHERWDGAGYPRGAKHKEIPIEGRITALADVFDALTTQRSYKPAFSVENSLGIVRQERGKHFDPDVVDAFFAGIEEILLVCHRFRDSAAEVAQLKTAAAPRELGQRTEPPASSGPSPEVSRAGDNNAGG